MGRRQGVLLVIILLGLGVLFWTNPVMAKFDYGDNRYCNFDVQLAPVTSAAPTVVIGQRGDYGTEIYGDNKGIERVKLTFERRSNGKFYYRYSTQTISYPFDGKWSEFTPMLETEEIIIKVFSESRVADSDESGIDINVINSTGLPVHFLIYGDDQERPRVGRIQVDQGLLRVNQQDVPSGTWQGLPQVCINNYPPPYHPLEVLMQENGIDVAFSPDRSMLALASTAHIVYIYSTDDYRLLQKLEGFRYPQRLAFSPATGDNILAVGLSSGVRLFNLTSGMTTSIELKYELKDFAFSPDGQHLAIATSSKVLICDTSTGGLLRTLEMSRVPNSVAFSPDWSMLACGYSKKGIDLYNASDGTLIRSLEPVPGKEISVYNLAFSPDSQKLAGYFHSDDRGQTGGICLWKLSDGSLLNRIEDIITYYQRASKLVFTPDSQHLVTLIDDVKFWNLPGLSLEYTLSPAKDISQIAISRDGQYLACLGIERIELWQIGNVVLPETGVRMTTCLDNMQSYRYLPLCYQVFAPEAVVKGRLYINDQVFEHDVGSWHQYNVITRWDKFFSSPGIYTLRYETENVNGNCQSSETIEIQKNGIKLTPRYLLPVALTVGDEPVTLTAEFFTDSASDTLIWETDNPEVLSLAEDRNSVTVTPLTPGNAWVSAKVADKSSASTGFIVYPAVNGINLDKSELIFGDGAVAGTLQAIISPEDTLKQQVLWRSTDESVARVEGNGLTATVTAVGSGEATIIAETEQGGYTASCRVTVPVGPLFTTAQLYDTGSNGTGLRLIFNRDISPDSAYDSISLNNDNGQPVECTMSINGPRLDIVPTTGLQGGSTYSFMIPAASLKDNFGHSRPNSYQGQFIAVSSFSQNEGQGGYQAGIYEGYGIQPTEYNWTRQSRFNGGGGAEQKWSFATGAASPTAAVIGSDGTIYVSGDDGYLYAVNPDGSKKWAYYTGKGTSPVIGEDGTIYVGSEDGNLYAINSGGSKKWCYYTTDSFSRVLAAPAIAKDGTIYFGSTDQHLYALNPDGTMKWSYYTDFGGAIFTTPAIASDGTIYVTTNRIDKILYAINPDGSLKWSLDGIFGTPVIGSDGTIYVGEDDLCAINPDGTIKWTLAEIKNSGIALSKEGNIYAASGNGKVLALDLSGKQKWEYLINDKPTGSPLIGSDGTVYIASNKGQLYAINLEGICLWQYDTGNTLAASPSMGADGTIYLTAADGNLYAIDTGSDINPPILISTNPENGSQYIKVDTAITFLFNEKIQAGSAFDNITVMDDDNNPITFNKEISGRTLTITPTDQWPYGAKYKLTIPTSAVYDLTNNGIPNEYCYTFVTVTAPGNNQGEGYQAGAYDQGAVQPTVYNWSRQSRFNGSDSAGQEWMHRTDSYVSSPPTIGTDGVIYLSTSAGLEAISSDGSKKWTFLKGKHISSSPAIGWDGTIYVGTYSEGFYAINPDGSQKWPFLKGNSSYSSPAIGADETIYVGFSNGNLYAINPDGRQKWAFATGGYIDSSPAIGTDGTIYVGSHDQNLYAINPDGSQKWSLLMEEYIDCSPAIGADGTIYVGCYQSLYAINPDGSQKWSFPTRGRVGSSVAIGVDGTIYVGSSDGNLYAINPDGSQKWSFATEKLVRDPVIGANGIIYIGSKGDSYTGSNGYLYAINPEGSPKWCFTTGHISCSSPAIGDGVFYVYGDRELFCIGPDKEAPNIIRTNPVNESTRASVNQNIYVSFNENIQAGPAYDLISIKDDQSNLVPFTKDIRLSTLIIKPDRPLNTYSKYFVSVPSNAVTDIALNNFAMDYEFSFTTWTTFSNNQGSGYQPGAYDQEAVQPASFNWSRQSRYSGSDSATLMWSFTTKRISYSTPAIGRDGTLYIGTDGGFYAINSDGSQKWLFQADSVFKSSPAIGADGTIYIASNGLWAINPDGSPKWKFSSSSSGSSPAIGDDGTIYIGSNDQNLYAVNPDGTHKWSFTTGGKIASSPAIDADGTIYVSSDDKKLYAVNRDGSLKWSFTTGGEIASSPAIGADGTIYVGFVDGNLYAINPDGSQQWLFEIGYSIYSGPAIGKDGTIYIEAKRLWAINPDGTKKWSTAENVSISGSPIIGADGTIYIGTCGQAFFAFNPDGSQKWAYIADGDGSIGTKAAIDDGVVYICGGGSNIIYCIGADKKPPLIIRTDPENGSSQAATCQSIMISFNENVKTGPSYHLITIKDAQNRVVPCIKEIQPLSLILKPCEPLNGYTQHYVFIPSDAITDNSSNSLASDYEFSFTTWAVFDNNQGAGYQPGAYDQEAIQPAVFNWSRQSKFIGSNCATRKWSFMTGRDIGSSSPAIGADGTIYIGSNDKNLYAINPDGSQKWSFMTGRLIYFSSAIPAIGVNGTIYAGSRDKNVYAINPNGSQKWMFTTGDCIVSSPAIGADGTIYVGSCDKNLYAINPDGSKKWYFVTSGEIHSSPAIGVDGTIYIGSSDGNLYAINLCGNKVWSFTTGGMIYSSPAIGADGTIYVGSYDKNLYAINPDGSQKWSFPTIYEIYSSPAIGADGTIYVGSYDKNLYAINPDGSQKWSFITGDWIKSSPIIGADGTIYIGSADKHLYAINPDGSLKWNYATGNCILSSPAIGADGTIYVGSDDKCLYAIGTPNQAPEAVEVVITREPLVGETLTASYTYQDGENDPEGQSIFKWYRCANVEGTGKEEIPEAGNLTYTLTVADEGTYLFFEVTPVAAAGTLTGIPVLSAACGPVSGSPEEDPVAAELTGLSIKEGTDGEGNELLNNFEASNHDYSIQVAQELETVKVLATSVPNTVAKIYIDQTEKLNGVIALKNGANVITVVVSEESKTDRTYTITIHRSKPNNNDATLSDLKMDGTTVIGFAPFILSYNLELPYGTSAVPAITATATDNNASVVVTLAEALPGATTIIVTAEDGVTTKTYTVEFTVAAAPNNNDATLSDLKMDGTTVIGFAPSILRYNLELPYGTSAVPAITATATDNNASVVITLAEALPGATTIIVTAEDGVTTKTYTVEFTVAAAPKHNDATLSDLKMDGTTVIGFAPSILSYNLELPYGTNAVPAITATATDNNASVVVTSAEVLPGATTIVVTAEDGVTIETYTINFKIVQSIILTSDSPEISVNTTPLQVIVPPDVNNAALTTNAVNGIVTIPQINVQSNTSLGTVDLRISEGTEVTGSLDWNGTINLPQVLDNNSVTIIPDSGYTTTISTVIEIGLSDITLAFSKPVRIMLSGQGGKKAGWIQNGSFTAIDFLMTEDSANALGNNSDGYITVGNDLVIWTKHFTIFVAYTETALDQDECFIATAAYGSKFTPAVTLLRHFRDDFLMTNSWGIAFVNFYYHNSPPIANCIVGNGFLKTTVRLLLTPIVIIVYALYHPIQSIAALFALSTLILYWRRRKPVIE